MSDAGNNVSFQGEVKVASRIVDYLSSGLYESPGACLKELVNNAYDADATLVEIFVKPDADVIIIEDNGLGMSKAEFVTHFERVSESHKRQRSDTTPSGRKKVGKIGIGFIAANEICDEMEIHSTQEGSEELLQVSVNFDMMREPPEDRRRDETDFAKGDYTGTVGHAKADDHYTHIYLKRVRSTAREILATAQKSIANEEAGVSLYGLNHRSVENRLADGSVRTWEDLDSYSRTMLEVALNVPVPYHDEWISEEHRKDVSAFESHVAGLEFSVVYDGVELRKPTVFRSDDEPASIVSVFEYEGDDVSAKAYFYVQHGVLTPQELNGVLLRIRDAAVGDYDSSFWGFSSSRGTLFQRWISGEVWASDDLEDAMNIDRRTLRDAHPAVVELQRVIHQWVGDVIERARRELHGRASAQRKEVRLQQERETIGRLVERHQEERGKSKVLNEVTALIDASRTDSPAGKRRLLSKFSVSEVYDLILDVAAETLEKADFEAFVGEVNRRLFGDDRPGA